MHTTRTAVNLLSLLVLLVLSLLCTSSLAAPIRQPPAEVTPVLAQRSIPMLEIRIKPEPQPSSWSWRKRDLAPKRVKQKRTMRPLTNKVIIIPQMIEGKHKKKLKSVFEESLAELASMMS